MKKRLVTASIALFVVFLVLGFILWNRYQEHQENERALMHRVWYATTMRFTTRGEYAVTAGHVLSVFEINRNDPNVLDYTELVLVYSKEEATGFDEHVLVAWPSRPPYWGYATPSGLPVMNTEASLGEFVRWIRENHPDIDFRDYGLPADEITLFDVVYNWEIVDEIRHLYGRYWQW